MKDVYITDHKAKPAKFNTTNAKEDEQFYKYHQSLQQYNTETNNTPRISQFESGRFERGSLAQRVFEPLAGAKRNENGTLVYEVLDKELSYGLEEARLRSQFERAQNQSPIEQTEEEAEELRIALMEEIQANDLPLDEWNTYLDQELSVFKEGQNYDYVKDLQDGFSKGLQTSTALKIFRTLPAHVFWDIKKPIDQEEQFNMNPYNPARKYPNENFFDIR